MGQCPPFFTHDSAGLKASCARRKIPLGPHPRVGPAETVVWGGGDSPRRPIILRHPRHRGISDGDGRIRARSTVVAVPPIPRVAKWPSFRDIVTDAASPFRQLRRAICVRISDLHPRWLKMGRKMRPISAAPHQDRCGQMDSEFPDYIIARLRARAIRPIGREVQRKRAPEARLSPVRPIEILFLRVTIISRFC